MHRLCEVGSSRCVPHRDDVLYAQDLDGSSATSLPVDRVPCQVVLILCVCIKMVSSLPLGCWCRDQRRGANSCQRHGTTQSGVIARPYWDVGTRGLIFFNFSFGDRSGQTASEKPCEILLLDVQWKLVFGTQSKLGEGGTNRLSGGHRTF